MNKKVSVAAPGFILACVAVSTHAAEKGSDIIRVLFLGDRGHHRPADRFKQLQPYSRTAALNSLTQSPWRI
jgi:hypothetical protein